MTKYLEVFFDDGRVRRYDFENWSHSSAMSTTLTHEIDVRFDDLSEGLYAEFAHDEISNEEQVSDERGRSARNLADGYILLLSVEELSHAVEVVYNDKSMLQRLDGYIVNMAKLSSVVSLYIGSVNGSLTDVIAVAGNVLMRKHSEQTEDEAISASAFELGVPEPLFRQIMAEAAENLPVDEEDTDEDAFYEEEYTPEDLFD
jgi:hypothetical protein